MDDERGEGNSYRELVVNNAEKGRNAKDPNGTVVNIK